MSGSQNVQRYKMSGSQNVWFSKRPALQNVLSHNIRIRNTAYGLHTEQYIVTYSTVYK